MDVFVATITHRHGTNSYAARTEKGLNHQLAEYCREWWDEAGLPPITPEMTDREIFEAYFEECGDEFYTIDRITLED